jgi:3-hydroxybutyryl-CoA dehydratase
VNHAEFRVEVTLETARAFAEVSGDWNPLHTDPAHAAGTTFRHPVLHGAFSAGLLSRMAGMYLPGTDCLLHSLQLRFIAPIIPPASLVVRGDARSGTLDVGRVNVSIIDANSGIRYVEGSYGFGRHEHGIRERPAALALQAGVASGGSDVVLVTGASGAIGTATLAQLGAEGVGLSRPSGVHGALDEHVEDEIERVGTLLAGRRLRAIVHCGWPAPDNGRLLADSAPNLSVEHHVAAPLRQILLLAHLLERFGREHAILVLLGSTAAVPGRHNYRMPLYSTAKSMIPTLTRALAVELGASGKRVAAVVLDVVDGGMNERMSRSARVAHASRSPFGIIATPAEVAGQLCWLVRNDSVLASGAVISLTGGSIP